MTAALVDAVRVESVAYALDTEATIGGLPTLTWEPDTLGAYPAIDLAAALTTGGSATVASVTAEGPLASHVTVDPTGGWSASFNLPGGLADGSYPVTFRVTDGLGGAGAATVLLRVGVANDAPTIGGVPATLAATEHSEATFDFTIADANHSANDLIVDLGVDAPASLQAAHAAGTAVTHVSGDTYRFAWTPTGAGRRGAHDHDPCTRHGRNPDSPHRVVRRRRGRGARASRPRAGDARLPLRGDGHGRARRPEHLGDDLERRVVRWRPRRHRLDARRRVLAAAVRQRQPALWRRRRVVDQGDAPTRTVTSPTRWPRACLSPWPSPSKSTTRPPVPIRRPSSTRPQATRPSRRPT